MIYVTFYKQAQVYTGFELRGHAGTAPAGKDLVCAFVSSAAYMTANTLTDVLHLPIEPEIDEGFLRVRLSPDAGEAAQALLQGFHLHLRALAKQYPRAIKIIYGGKNNA